MDADKLTMRDAVEILGIEADFSYGSANIICPVCGDGSRKKKMNINFRNHEGEGTFRCPKCDTGGGPLQFWALFRGLDINAPAKELSADYHAYMRSQNKDGKKEVRKTYTPPPRIDVDTADVDTRHRTYEAFLSMLTLSPSHKENLLERGLDEETIRKKGYKSAPLLGHEAICQNLLNKGYVLEGVPGFYKDSKGTWTFLRFSSGFLIPQRDGRGRIQGMQIRLENPFDDRRYFTISTGEKYNKGAKGLSVCHLARGKDLKDIIITEGPLKADIISYFTGYSVIAVPGVSSLGYLKQALYDLKCKGMQKVTIAYDMDLYEKDTVEAALNRLKKMLEDMYIPYTVLVWDKEYKGLDDWLLHEKMSKEV